MPTFAQLLAMMGRSIQAPREGAAEILSLGVPRQALGLILALVVVLLGIVTEANLLVAPLDENMPAALVTLIHNPVAMAAMQMAGLAMTIAAIFWIGRAFGGTGGFEETVLLVSWLQFIGICLSLAQLVLYVLNPVLGEIFGLATAVLSIWMLTHFIAALHGFRSALPVFGMMVATAFALIFLAALLLLLAGVQPPSGEV